MATKLSAQIVIQGKVLNAGTKQPIENVSVYINNTQIGTSSDSKGQFKLYPKKIYGALVISAIGYESKTINIDAGSDAYTILLKEKSNSLMEVKVHTGKNDWKRWGELFSVLLLGNNLHSRQYCKILNRKDIRFYYDEDKQYLEAIADKPILIKNKAMNCLIHVDIDDFSYSFTDDNFIYSASVFYEGFNKKRNKSSQLAIETNYLGSRMHFYRSLYANKIDEENFRLYRYTSVKNLERQRVIKTVQQYKAAKMAAGINGPALNKLADNPDSSLYYKKILAQNFVLKWDTTRVDYKQFLSFDRLKNKMMFKFNDTLMVVYSRHENMAESFTSSTIKSDQSSIVKLTTLIYLTDKDGVNVDPIGYATPNWLQMSGDMAERRLAEQLPYDFIYSP